MSPAVAGTVRKASMRSALAQRVAQALQSPSAARRARPVVAIVPTATPKTPIGRYSSRKA